MDLSPGRDQQYLADGIAEEILFAGFRDHPHFVALVEQMQRDLSRQRAQLESVKD